MAETPREQAELMKLKLTNTVDDWGPLCEPWDDRPESRDLAGQIKARLGEKADPPSQPGSTELTLELDAPEEYWRWLLANPPWPRMDYSPQGIERSRQGRGLVRLLQQLHASFETR